MILSDEPEAQRASAEPHPCVTPVDNPCLADQVVRPGFPSSESGRVLRIAACVGQVNGAGAPTSETWRRGGNCLVPYWAIAVRTCWIVSMFRVYSTGPRKRPASVGLCPSGLHVRCGQRGAMNRHGPADFRTTSHRRRLLRRLEQAYNRTCPDHSHCHARLGPTRSISGAVRITSWAG